VSRDHHVYTVPPPRLERLVHGERWVAARVRPGTAQPHEQARVVLGDGEVGVPEVAGEHHDRRLLRQ
jgi:hypothetical protein